MLHYHLGVLPLHGFIRQENIPLKVFLENRLGRVYAQPGSERSPLDLGIHDDHEHTPDPTCLNPR